MNKNNLPSIYSYGDYSNGNYGAHCICIEIPPSRKGKYGIDLYFSYNTLVAFRGKISDNERGLYVHKNVWGSTTGKHLNFIDYGNKDSRYDSNTFEKLYKKALKNA